MDQGLRDEAKRFLQEHDLIDLHVEGMLPHRLFGYDLNKRHTRTLLGPHKAATHQGTASRLSSVA